MQPLSSTSLVHRVRGELGSQGASRRRKPIRSPRMEVVATTDAHEGPVYAADEHALYFTTKPIPGDPFDPAIFNQQTGPKKP